MIAPAWRDRLHEYLGVLVRRLDGVPQGIGGVADHVHRLVTPQAAHCLSDFMRDLKFGGDAETKDDSGRSRRLELRTWLAAQPEAWPQGAKVRLLERVWSEQFEVVEG